MMKKKIKLCVILCVVIVLSYFYAHIDKNSYLYDRNADTATFYGTNILSKDEEVRQRFVSEENTIDGINIKIATFGNVDDITLNYSVFDETSVEVSRSEVKGSKIENNKFNQLELPTIAETKGKPYTLVLSVENCDEQNGIGFYIEPKSKENNLLTIRDTVMESTLVARIISHRFDVETFIVLLGIIAFVVMFMKVLYKFFK